MAILSVIVPVYNERNTILEILRRIDAVDLDQQVVIVDDGSTDGTRDILAGLSDRSYLIIYHTRNQGKGMAIKTGLHHATGDLAIVQDADLEYDPQDYPRLAAPLIKGECDVAYGSRRNFSRRRLRLRTRYYIAGVLLTWATNLLYGTRLTDVMTCYKMFRTDLLKSLPLDCTGFEFETEVTARLARRGIRICEVPISYHPRSPKEGKKIGWRDGFRALSPLLRYRFRAPGPQTAQAPQPR